jgi:hypothetical protein
MTITIEGLRRRANDLVEHDHIWLQPWCAHCRDRGDARCWSMTEFEPCEDCGRMPVRFDLAPKGAHKP